MQSIVSQTQIHEACAILIRFILLRLGKVSVYEIKWLLPALKSLCEGKPSANGQTKTTTTSSGGGAGNASTAGSNNANSTGGSCPGGAGANSNVLQFDYNAVAAVLKSSKYPETTKSIVTTSSTAAAGSNAGDKDSPKSEIKRSRSDLSSIIIHQLTAPLEAGKMTWVPLSEELTDCSVVIISIEIINII